jgi:hypothetical protein
LLNREPSEDSNMAPLSKAVIRLGALFFHVGIGPMIGLGPMDIRPERRTRNGARKVAEQLRPPAADRAVSACPKDRGAHAVAERAHAA